jgi:hypothetical protein
VRTGGIYALERVARDSARAVIPARPGSVKLAGGFLQEDDQGDHMPWRFGFRIGPFRYSERVGRTQAQKRAAARARDQRRRDREMRQAARDAQRPEAIAARQTEQEEWRRKREDHDARTYRAVVSECHIDALKGGAFTVAAEGRPNAVFNVHPDTALRFLSLKNGDIVQVTLGPDNSGLEEFWHLSRANGAKPRSPANFGPGELRSHRKDEDASPED